MFLVAGAVVLALDGSRPLAIAIGALGIISWWVWRGLPWPGSDWSYALALSRLTRYYRMDLNLTAVEDRQARHEAGAKLLESLGRAHPPSDLRDQHDTMINQLEKALSVAERALALQPGPASEEALALHRRRWAHFAAQFQQVMEEASGGVHIVWGSQR